VTRRGFVGSKLRAPCRVRWQLRNVARYASSFIKSQCVGDSSIAWIGIAVDISQALSVCVGCIEYNRWSWRGSNRLFMELPEEDPEEANSMMMLRSNVGPAWLQGLRYECKD
jgi:hypothetical protein